MTVLDPLPADVYGYAGLLDDTDTEILARVRRFAEQRIAPIADDYWDRAEFPHELIPGFAELDVVVAVHGGHDAPQARLIIFQSTVETLTSSWLLKLMRWMMKIIVPLRPVLSKMSAMVATL